MDKIKKALRKLNAKEKKSAKDILARLERNNFSGLDIQKLKGRKDIFRVRKGKLRIIYRKAKNQQIFILALERRSEKTYRGC